MMSRPAARSRLGPARARSSVGERSLHTREVAGSKPAAPIVETSDYQAFRCAGLVWRLVPGAHVAADDRDDRVRDRRAPSHDRGRPGREHLGHRSRRDRLRTGACGRRPLITAWPARARSTSARSTSGSPSARSSAAESWPAAACTPSLGSAPSWFRSRSGWHRSTRSAPGAPGWLEGRETPGDGTESIGGSRLRQGLGSQRRVWFLGERAIELAARADVELGEDLAEVVLDGTRADE
jgi:hypothetical protein